MFAEDEKDGSLEHPPTTTSNCKKNSCRSSLPPSCSSLPFSSGEEGTDALDSSETEPLTVPQDVTSLKLGCNDDTASTPVTKRKPCSTSKGESSMAAFFKKEPEHEGYLSFGLKLIIFPDTYRLTSWANEPDSLHSGDNVKERPDPACMKKLPSASSRMPRRNSPEIDPDALTGEMGQQSYQAWSAPSDEVWDQQTGYPRYEAPPYDHTQYFDGRYPSPFPDYSGNRKQHNPAGSRWPQQSQWSDPRQHAQQHRTVYNVPYNSGPKLVREPRPRQSQDLYNYQQ